LKIAICEDEQSEREALRDLLEAEIDQRRIDGEVVVFASGEAMLEAMRSEVFSINFLDIYMGGITGVELAQRIRARDKEAAIVFTTSSREHMAQGFELGVAHYLIKPYTQAAVTVALDRCLRTTQVVERFVEVTTNRENRRVFLAHIIWAESQDKSCVLQTTDESLRVYMRLDELLALINDARFLRCHRSFVVNLDHAVCVRNSDFVMADGSRIPIRREDRVKIKKLFEDYCFAKQRKEY
jgi:DNA-binding LytR/AlgR family response regulator